MLIPYTFKGGITAKANEVNANFKEVQKSVEANEDNIASIQASLGEYANINGNASNVFNVANGVQPYNAVNYNQLTSLISPFMSLINGYYFTLAGDYMLSISTGTCYDSTNTRLLSRAAGQLNLSGYSTDTPYNIFLFINEEGSDGLVFQIADTESPSLPNNNCYFRKIGTFTLSSVDKVGSLAMVGTRISPEEVINVTV